MRTTFATRVLAILLLVSLVLPSLAMALEPSVPALAPGTESSDPLESGLPEAQLSAQEDEELLPQASEVVPVVNVQGSTSATLPNPIFREHTVYFKDQEGEALLVSGTFRVRLIDAGGAEVAASEAVSLVSYGISFSAQLAATPQLAAGTYTMQVLQQQQPSGEFVAMSNVTLAGGIPVFKILPPKAYFTGPAVWPIGAAQSSTYSISFDPPLTGTLSLQLIDGSGNLAASAPTISLQSDMWVNFYPALYPCRSLSAGSYTLQALLDGEPLDVYLNGNHSNVVTVTDAMRVISANVKSLDSNLPTAEDRELFVQVTASGVSQAADLHLQLLDTRNDVPIVVAESADSRTENTELTKQATFLYQLELLPDQVLEKGATYTVRISSAADHMVLHTFDYDVPKGTSIERVQVDSASTGRITLRLANIDAGQVTVELMRHDGSAYLSCGLLKDVDYDGQGSLSAQLLTLDGQPQPVIMEPGFYQALVWREGSEPGSKPIELGNRGFQVHDGPYYSSYDAYKEAALLRDTPKHLSASGGEISFSFTLANVLPELPKVELIYNDAQEKQVVITATSVQWSSQQSTDVTRYRYVNTAMVDVVLNLPSDIGQGTGHQWRVTCTDRQGVERILLSDSYDLPDSYDLTVHTKPYVGSIAIAQGIQRLGWGESGPSTSYYVGLSTTELDVTLSDTWGITDLSQLSATLLASTDDVVGTIPPGGWTAESDVLQGSLTISRPFTDDEVRRLVLKYGGIDIATTEIIGMAEAGVSDLSVANNAFGGNILTAGSNLQIVLQRQANLLPDQLQVVLTTIDGQNVPSAGQTAQSIGGDIVVSSVFDQTLQGWYLLQVTHQGNKVQRLRVGEGHQPYYENQENHDGEGGMVVSEPIDAIPVHFTTSAYLADVWATDNGYELFGSGFAGTRSYQAAIFRDDDPSLALTLVPAGFVDDRHLTISDEAVQDLPRGLYRVYLLEDGVMAPTTQLLHLILRAGVKLVVQPQVSINGGAEFTFDPQVSLGINPGTFTKMKWSETLAGLATAAYQDVSLGATYTFSAELGEKTLYFRFSDQDGLESNLLTRRIQVVSSTLPALAESEFGVEQTDWRAGQMLTAWMRTSLPGVVASIKLHRADGTTEEQSLPRTLLEYGVSTYSKLLSITSAHSDVTGISFHLVDGRTGAKWDSEEKTVSFSNNSELRQARSSWERMYYSQPLIIASSPVTFTLTGTSGLTVTATVTYSDGLVDQTWTVNLTEETPGSRQYAAQETVPTDAARIKRVDYSISGPGYLKSVSSETINADVTGTIRFTGLANASGQFDDAWLYLQGKAPLWSSQQAMISGNNDVIFSGREPGTYTYQLVGNDRTYQQGEVTLQPGQTMSVSLSNVATPAQFTVQPDQRVGGDVYYHVVGVDNRVWDTYSRLGEPLTGLLMGDQISYSVHLDYQDLLTYLNPAPVEPTAALNVSESVVVRPLAMQEVAYVNVTGRVLDAAYQQAGKTQPVVGVTVQINQSYNNNGVWLHNNQRVTTNASGEFQLQLFKDQGGAITFSKASYRMADLTLPETGYAVDTALADALAQYADSGVIRWSTLTAAPVRNGEEPIYDPANIYLYVRSAEHDGERLNGYMRRNGEYLLSSESLSELQVDDQVTLQFVATDRQYQLVNQQVTVTLDPNRNATVDIPLQQLGYLQAALREDEQQPAVTDHMLVFYRHSDTRYSYRVGIFSGAGTLRSSSGQLNAGDYTVVMLRGDGLTKLNRIGTLSYLNDVGLVEGIDYILREATVQYGQITDLGVIPAPAAISDERLGYLANEGTSVSIRQDGFTANNKMKLTVTVRYRLRDDIVQSGGKLDYLRVSHEPANNVADKAYLNGALVSSTSVDLTTLAVSSLAHSNYGADGLGERQGVLSFQLETAESQLTLSASINVQVNNSWRYETIEQRTYDLPFVTVSEPPEVYASSSGRTLLSGVAFRDSVVDILDNGVVIGNAKSDARGRWQTWINLTDPTLPMAHQLQARVELADGSIAESPLVTCQVLPSGAAVVDDVRIWQDSHGITLTKVNIGDAAFSGSLPFYPNPNVPVRAWFKILNVQPDEVDVAALVDTNQGNSTMYPATYDKDGYWKVAAYGISRPGTFSIFFALKVQEDPAKEAEIVSKLTGSTQINVSSLPSQAEVDPGTLPTVFREMTLLDTDGSYVDGSDPSSDRIEANYDLGGGMSLKFQGSSSTVPNVRPDGAIRIDTAQGYYYTTPPTVSTTDSSITVTKTVWFSPELWSAISSDPASGASLRSAAAFSTLDTQDNLQRLDYTSTATGIAGDLYEYKKGAESLGKLGKGLTALGGVSLAGSVLLGRIGTDPAELRAAASVVEDATERAFLMREIDQYADATRKSHYINSFMGGVSYGASFFGPLGKGLSYVVTTGGQVFSNAIGNEYQIWSDAIISMIRSALAKQERKTGKKKDVLKPKWIMDPSGYIFAATESERIEGVKATVLLEEDGLYRPWTPADKMDDIYISPAENPLTTNPEGKFAWDVSPGNWKVRFEGTGYQTLETNAMTVLPAHTEVNVGLLATAAPTVKSVHVFPDAVEIEFDSYLLPSSLAGNIVLWDEAGNPIDVREVQLVQPVANSGYTGSGAYSSLTIESAQFVKQVRVIPEVATGKLAQFAADGETAAKYRVQIDKSVSSYASVAMATAYDQTLTIESRNSQSISGVVKYGLASGTKPALSNVTVRLLDNGAELQQSITAADGSYSLLGIAAGSYCLQFTKAAHVQRTVEVEVTSGGAFVVNAELALRGDANLDGDVSEADLVPISRHALGIELISEDLALLTADANQDSYVNGADVVPVNRHALGIELMQ